MKATLYILSQYYLRKEMENTKYLRATKRFYIESERHLKGTGGIKC